MFYILHKLTEKSVTPCFFPTLLMYFETKIDITTKAEQTDLYFGHRKRHKRSFKGKWFGSLLRKRQTKGVHGWKTLSDSISRRMWLQPLQGCFMVGLFFLISFLLRLLVNSHWRVRPSIGPLLILYSRRAHLLDCFWQCFFLSFPSMNSDLL